VRAPMEPTVAARPSSETPTDSYRLGRRTDRQALRRGAFHSVPDLIAAIEDDLAVHNNEPKPLIWTATVESVLE
jgi:hypothetical protein